MLESKIIYHKIQNQEFWKLGFSHTKTGFFISEQFSKFGHLNVAASPYPISAGIQLIESMVVSNLSYDFRAKKYALCFYFRANEKDNLSELMSARSSIHSLALANYVTWIAWACQWSQCFCRLPRWLQPGCSHRPLEEFQVAASESSWSLPVVCRPVKSDQSECLKGIIGYIKMISKKGTIFIAYAPPYSRQLW